MSTIAAGTTSGTALVSTGNTDGTLQLQVNGTTPSVTLATTGAIGVGSTPGYGTSGQVLTSAGSAAAPTWTTPVVPGATEQYSVVGLDLWGGYATQAFNPSGLASGLIYTNNANGLYASGSGTMRSTGNPFWSSYYGCWFTMMLSTSSTIYGIAMSQDGLGWRIVLPNLSSAIGVSVTYITGPSGAGGAPILAVDDSNGRFFLMYSNGTSVIVAYSSITSTVLQTGNWTLVTLAAATRIGGVVYCKMATTGASGIVAYFNNDTSVPIYTCSAGGTTFTLRHTITGVSTEQGYLDYQENGFISLPIQGGGLKVGYNLSGDITTGWATGTFSAAPTNSRKGFVGNGYMVYTSGGALYWSTNGTSWTLQLVGSTSGNLNGFAYTGSVWIAWDAEGTYISATNAITSTWSIYSGGANIKRNIGIGNPYNVRITAA